MQVTHITVTHAATVPTGQYANQRIELTASADILEGEDWRTETIELKHRLRELVRAEITIIRNPNANG